MKRLLLSVAFLISMCATSEAMIYRNRVSAPTKVDTFSCVFGFYDANMKPARIATDDYLLVTVIGPTGAVVYDAKIDSSSAKIIEEAQESPQATDPYIYTFADQVSNIDGSGSEGMYWVHLTAVDTSGATSSPFLFPMEVYNKSYYAVLDSINSSLAAEFTNVIANDSGSTFAPCEVHAGSDTNSLGYPLTVGEWGKFKSKSSASDADSVNTNSVLDLDLDNLVETPTTESKRLVLHGDSTIAIYCQGSDSIFAVTRLDVTNETATKYFQTISFDLYVDLMHWHEGFGGDNVQGTLDDGDTPLDYVGICLDNDTLFTGYMRMTLDEQQLVRGWNKIVLCRDDFTAVGSAGWPTDDEDADSLRWMMVVVKTDSTGSRVRVMIDNVRYNKRSNPVFMFRLDDGHITTSTMARYVFDRYGFTPAVMVCDSDMVSGMTNTRMKYVNVDTLYNLGWDVGNHGRWANDNDDGSDSLRLVNASLQNDRMVVQYNYKKLLDNGFKRSAGFFAYPYDHYDTTGIRAVMEVSDFATGGKTSYGWFDHVDNLPADNPYATTLKYIYPYFPYTSSVATDSMLAYIDRTITRGTPFIIGMHSWRGHHVHIAATPASSGTPTPWVVSSEGYTGLTDLYALLDDSTAWDDNDWIAFDPTETTTNDYVLCSLDVTPASGRHPAFSNPPDSATITFRVRAVGDLAADSVHFVVDTASAANTFKVLDTVGGVQEPFSSEWTNYSYTIRMTSTNPITGDDFTAGIKLLTPLEAGDTIFWSGLRVKFDDDSSSGVATDTSTLNTICAYLKKKEAEISVLAPSDYFRTEGSGGRLTKAYQAAREARDSLLSISTTLTDVANINDSLQAVLDSIQSHDDWVAKQASLITTAQVNAEVDNALNTAIPGSPTPNSINERIATLDDNYTTTKAGYLDEAISSQATPAEVRAQVNQALDSLKLDHLLLTKPGVGVGPTDSTFIALLASKSTNGAWSTYNNTTDALEAIRDRGDVAWITATGFSTLTTANIHDQTSRVMDSLRLDHLLLTKPGAGVAPTDSTFFALLATKSTGGTWSNYNNVTDALEAIRDRGDVAWITATGFSTLGAADIHTQTSRVMDSLRLDHLLLTKPGIGAAPTDSTFFALLVSSSTSGAWSAYVNTTDALQALRDRGDAAWITATGFSTFNPATTPVEILASGGSAGKNAEELVDDTWNEDTTGHTTPNKAGYWLTVGGGSGISEATLRDALGDSLLDLKRVFVAAKGLVSGATPGDSGFSSAALTQVNDYWNDNQVLFTTGGAAGQVFRVVDFVAATDSMLLTPAWPAAAKPAQNDSFVVIGLLGATGSGGGVGGDSAAIVNGIMALMPDTIALYSAGVGGATCGQGLGSAVITVYDTSGVDFAVAAAWVTIRNMLSGEEFSTFTVSGGAATFSVFDNQDYEVLTYKSGYYFYPDTINLTTPGGSIASDAYGYNIVNPTASAPYTCRLNGYIQNSFGTAVQNAMVRVCPDNSGTGKFGNVTVVSRCKTVTTNSAGAFTIDVIWSDSLAVRSGDSTFLYNITVLVADESAPGQWREFTVAERIRIPSEVSYNINLFIKED